MFGVGNGWVELLFGLCVFWLIGVVFFETDNR